jgi:hypothetical protein
VSKLPGEALCRRGRKFAANKVCGANSETQHEVLSRARDCSGMKTQSVFIIAESPVSGAQTCLRLCAGNAPKFFGLKSTL